jgi:molybdenum cofactor guanylyltransferase
MRAAGFVLVGGNSTRMGQDKAFLPWRSTILVKHVADKVRCAAGTVTLIGQPQRYEMLGLPCLPDLHPGNGPLAGIEAALESNQGEFNLILACDTPELSTSHLKQLLSTAAGSSSRCVVTKDDAGGVHPLCAVYRSDCLPAVRRCVEEGRLQVTRFVEEIGAHYITTAVRIHNLNTPEEWNKLLADQENPVTTNRY